MQGSTDIYFHNEKFDGEFMLSWLFKTGSNGVKKQKKIEHSPHSSQIWVNGMLWKFVGKLITQQQNQVKRKREISNNNL